MQNMFIKCMIIILPLVGFLKPLTRAEEYVMVSAATLIM